MFTITNGDLSAFIQATMPHFIYLPHPGHSREQVLERCVGLMYSLPLWNISARQDGEMETSELAAQARVCGERVKQRQPYLTAHLDALRNGF